ncbi:CHC2 zinc finger domain-containing protein [Helicobacter pylori]
MKITNLEPLKERIQIVEVLERYMDLYKAGANFKAFCPFHEERSASFIVSPEKNIYHCFGCGVSGDALKFLQEYQKISFIEAVEEVAKIYHYPLKYETNAKTERNERLKELLAYDQLDLNGNRSVSMKAKEQPDELKTILNNLSKELEKLNEQSEVNSIQVFSDKLEVLKDAPTRLWGFSTLSNANEGFYNENNEQLASGSVLLFRSDKVGKHTITFKASNAKTSLAKNITISVIANKLKERTS